MKISQNIKIITSITLIIFFIAGCTESDLEVNNQADATLREIESLTQDYISSQQKNGSTAGRIEISDDVARTDIDAGVAEYESSHDLDMAIHMGVEASAKALSIALPNSGGNVDNKDNPLDFAGKYHVEILREGLTTSKELVYKNGVFNYDNMTKVVEAYFRKNGRVFPMDRTVSEQEFNQFYQARSTKLNQANDKLSGVIENMKLAGKISQVEHRILFNYFSAYESSTSLDSFIQYTFQIEDLVINSSYQKQVKNLLLFTMATTRHDVNFWNPYPGN